MQTSGMRAGYAWYQAADLFLGDLLDRVPELFRHRFVAVTSFDSGLLTLAPEEQQAGWCVQDGIAISPQLGESPWLPHGGYDEWYVYEQPPPGIQAERFVNCGRFSLRDPQMDAETVDPTWDSRLMREQAEAVRAVQERFWEQLVRLCPESYLAEGDVLICVTRSAPARAALDSLFAHSPG
jgi:hypothetical protein